VLLLAAVSDRAPGAELSVPVWAWGAFLAGLVALLLVDLLVVNREAHEPTLREAALTSAVWIAIGLGFAVVVLATLGSGAAGQYLAGYVVEESLSVDNVFVWAVIFAYFAVPREHQHRVLFWGIFGALGLRAIFIFAGVALLSTFSWVEYLFGAFLLFTAVRVARQGGEEIHPERNPVLRVMRRLVPVSAGYHGQRFFVREDGSLKATPLLVVLVLVEATDVVFAVDSVPAILGISRQQFIVFTSNALAIMGLRALYFLVSSAADRLVHLNKGLGVILAFVGAKMLASHWVHLATWMSLVVIAAVLATTVVTSLSASRAEAHREALP
jgi:tellurite resistance protein TerC